MDTFPVDRWPPRNGIVESSGSRVNIAQFGDGYFQSSLDGINTDTSTLSLTWVSYRDGWALEVFAFLSERLSRTPFLFKAPDWPVPRVVVCEKLEKTNVSSKITSVSASFRRTAHLGV